MAMIKLSKEEFVKMVLARQKRKRDLKVKADREIYDMIDNSRNKGIRTKKRKLTR